MPIDTIEHLRTFHLTALAPDDAIPDGPLRPAILSQLADLPSVETFYKSTLPYHPDSLLQLHSAALSEARRTKRASFWEDVRLTASRLREMLLLDKTHAPGAISAESVTASLGARVEGFFKPALLAKALQRPVNPLQCMEPERRSRCEITLAMLEEALLHAAGDPESFLFRAGNADNFAAALDFCNARLDSLTHLLRALRVARLEINAAFDPAIHEEMLARFDWQSAASDELFAIPPIVVLETADRLAQTSLTSFGRLLRSGRPVQILIARATLEPQDIGGVAPDFAYLSIAHRESFVLQSSMAQPDHLLAGLAAMAETQRPAVAVVSVAGDWLADSLLVLSRAIPLYLYDPDGGLRWADRFCLFVPPPTDVTPAHAAALSTDHRRHFRVIPESAWNKDQMDLPTYLAAYQSRPPLAIPYIIIAGGQRALLTRDLANYCVDRRRAWDLFEDLSAVGQPQPTPNPAANDDARREGAKEALQQVIAMLTSTV